MVDICIRFLFCFEKQNKQNYSELNKAPTYEQNVLSDKHNDILERETAVLMSWSYLDFKLQWICLIYSALKAIFILQ